MNARFHNTGCETFLFEKEVEGAPLPPKIIIIGERGWELWRLKDGEALYAEIFTDRHQKPFVILK